MEKKNIPLNELKVGQRGTVSQLLSDTCLLYTSVELCSLSADKTEDGRYVTLELAKELTQRSAMRYDKDGDEHYDLLSAFQKSMRGSDPDADVYKRQTWN